MCSLRCRHVHTERHVMTKILLLQNLIWKDKSLAGHSESWNDHFYWIRQLGLISRYNSDSSQQEQKRKTFNHAEMKRSRLYCNFQIERYTRSSGYNFKNAQTISKSGIKIRVNKFYFHLCYDNYYVMYGWKVKANFQECRVTFRDVIF